jgi:hypothetical protein
VSTIEKPMAFMRPSFYDGQPNRRHAAGSTGHRPVVKGTISSLIPSWRRVTCCALVALVACAAAAAAQTSTSTLVVVVTLPDGSPATGALVEAAPVGAGAVRTATISKEMSSAVLPLAPGSYRVQVRLSGFRPAEGTQDLAPGGERRLGVRLAPEAGMGNSTMSVDGRIETSYQTNMGPEWVRDLPSSRTVWSLLETAHPFVISDTLDNGGLWSARPALLGGSGPAWNQTQFRIDGLDATDPRELGTPAFYPDLGLFDAVGFESARTGAEIAGPGPVISLIPRRPGEIWTGTGEAFITPGQWQPDPAPGIAPALGRFDSWTDAGLSASGPISGRTGLFAAIRGTHGGRVERDSPLVLSNNVASLYGHLVGTAGTDRELRITTSLSRQTRPFAGRARYADRDIEERGRTVLGQASVEQLRAGTLLALSGGFHRVSNDPDVTAGAAAGNVERLLDGSPLSYGDYASTISQRWSLNASFAPPAGTWLNTAHSVRVGGSIGRSTATNTAIVQPAFGELVDGVPARVWDIRSAGAQSHWKATTASAFVSDRWDAAPKVAVNAGLRFDYDNGSAEGAAQGISWASVSPRFALRWMPRDNSPLAVTTGYSWYRNRLPLTYLGVGDPAGPTGTVSRWDDRNGDLHFTSSELTPFAYVGSCCANGLASAIDSDLAAPYVTEFFIGAEHRLGNWRMRMVGMDRREHSSVALVNTGVTAADYDTRVVRDSGIDVDGGTTMQDLTLFGRRPSSLGRDRYELTNPDGLSWLYQGVDITVDREYRRRYFFRFGGSAYRIKGIGMSRGFLPNENDQGVLGEAFLSPNAQTSADGRTFFDRAFVIKMAGGYHAPGDVRIGISARYHDGQPFSRMVIADGLYQGRDLVMAIPRGAQRFTYTYTLDAKVEKDVVFGKRRVGLVLEAFNLTNATLEVEEYVVTGSAFRTISAVQPPLAVRAGVRVGF